MLKRISLASAGLALLATAALAQETERHVTAKDVPAAVIENFKRAYPKAIIHGYASETEDGKQYYEIESREGGVRRDVLYNPDGTIAEIEESIETSALPAAALQALKQKHPRAVITLAEKKTIDGKIVSYEIAARQGRRRFKMEFDADGNVLPAEKQ